MKNLDVIKEILFLVVISMIFLTAICGDDAKVTPTPTPTATATAEPTPTACCPDESTLQAVYWDPKDEEIKGEMTDVTLSSDGIDITNSGRTVRWQDGMEVVIYAGGGDDTDYCVNTETGMAVRTLDPEVTFSWLGYGYVDENNDRIFHLTPSGAGTYAVSVTAEDGGECNAGPESESASCEICVYEVVGVSGPNNATRGQSCMYQVDVYGGIEAKYYFCSSYYDPQNTTTSNYWCGKIVLDTTVYCIVTLICPYKGYEFDVNTIPFRTQVVKRGWSIEVPTAVYSPDYIDEIAYICGTQATAGKLRDADSNSDIYKFNPNPHVGGFPYCAFDPEGIIDFGPNHGKWYVFKSNFKIQQEFLINEWLRSGGLIPPGSNINWYDQNVANCNAYFGTAGVANYINALILHENEGNHEEWPGISSGHNAVLRVTEYIGDDLNETIEDNVSDDLYTLLDITIFQDYYNIEGDLSTDPGHTFVKRNWSPYISDTIRKEISTYDTNTNEWLDCDECYDDTNP